MTIIYESFRMRYGVRKPAEIFSPRLVPIAGFPGMPWGSILHYVGEGVDDYGPSIDNLFLRPYKSSIMVDTITKPLTTKGNPRKLAVNIHAMVKSFHVKNYRMRPLRKWDTVIKDKRMPIVVNYAMFPYTMRYLNNFMMVYNRWFNTYSTLWHTVNDLATKYDRMHFIPINIPSDMPGIADLRRAEMMLDDIDGVPSLNDEEAGTESFDIGLDEKGHPVVSNKDTHLEMEADPIRGHWLDNALHDRAINVSMEEFIDSVGLEALTRPVLEVFSSNELLTILDIWTWMGENRHKSVMNMLSDEALKKVNLAFMEGGRITVLNLSLLNKMRQDPDKGLMKGLQPKQAQRLLLRYMDAILQLRSQKSSEETEVALDEESEDLVDVVDDGMDDQDDQTKNQFEELPDIEFEEPPEMDSDEFDDEMKAILDSDVEFETPQKIDKTFAAEVNKTLDKLSDETVIKLNRHKLSPDLIVKQQADELAESGAITAQDYKRIGRLSEKYKTLKDPYGGDQTLEELMQITEEDLAIPEKVEIPADFVGLPDKSMKGVTLKTMQKRYLKKVMKKDIVNTIMSIQNEGIMVQNYKIEKVRTFMDEYDVHTVSVVPTKGAPSTIRLKVQHVRDDGVFICNGVKNRICAQRGD